ncbi:MAG: hypothetical protein AB7O93_19620 [Vicinamibacterales bacterium]
MVKFVPTTAESLVSSAGGIALPLVALAVAGPLLFVLSRLWITPNALLAGSVLVTLGSLVLLALATVVVGAVRRLVVALAGGRPVRTATLSLEGGAGAGSGVNGTLHLSWRLAADESVRAVLTCTVSSDGTDGWAVSHRFVREQTVDAAACQPGLETRVPVAMPLPPEAPPSGVYEVAPRGERLVVWTLAVAVLPNGPVLPDFVVAVRPAATGPVVVPDRLPAEAPPVAAPSRPAHSRVAVRPAADGIDVALPMPSGWRSLLVWGVVTIPMWVVLPWLAWNDPRDWPGNLVVALAVPALVNGVPLLMLLAPGRLVVQPGGIELSRGTRRRKRAHVLSVRRAEVRAMPPVMPVATDVWLHRGDEPPWFVYRGGSQAEAQWLAAEIGRALDQAREARQAGR